MQRSCNYLISGHLILSVGKCVGIIDLKICCFMLVSLFKKKQHWYDIDAQWDLSLEWIFSLLGFYALHRGGKCWLPLISSLQPMWKHHITDVIRYIYWSIRYVFESMPASQHGHRLLLLKILNWYLIIITYSLSGSFYPDFTRFLHGLQLGML